MATKIEKIIVGEGGQQSLVRLLGSEPTRLEVVLGAEARCEVVFVAAEAAEAQHSICVEMAGRGAELNLYGLISARQGDDCGVATEVRHMVGGCTSHQLIKGIASGDGVATFDGLVYVAPDAQQTDAHQQSRNMLLSPSARIHTNPQLEIYADDVQCSHGATVGNIDDEAIYYMRQRGLSEEQARRLQVLGFVGEILGHIPSEEERERVEQMLCLPE